VSLLKFPGTVDVSWSRDVPSKLDFYHVGAVFKLTLPQQSLSVSAEISGDESSDVDPSTLKVAYTSVKSSSDGSYVKSTGPTPNFAFSSPSLSTGPGVVPRTRILYQ
jgi:hypothetical protein